MNKLAKLVIASGVMALVAISGVQVSVHFRNAKANTPETTPTAISQPSGPTELAGMNVSNFKPVLRGRTANLQGMEQSWRFTVSFGPQPDYFLTKTSLADGTSTTIAPVATMDAKPVPGTNKIAFTAVGNNQKPYPVYVVNDDGTDLRQIGSTDTPWRLQVTGRGLIAFRSGRSLVVFDATTGESTALPGITLIGEYPHGDTIWSVSPDGTRVALRDQDKLTLVDTVTGEKRVVGGELDRRRETVGTWSPDGSLFAYATEPRTKQGMPTLWLASPEEPERILYEHSPTGGMFWDIAWASSNRLIANYVPGGPVGSAIPAVEYYGVSTNGGAKLLFKNGFGLTISPDGKRVMFRRQMAVKSLTDFEIIQADINWGGTAGG